jgi:hypothetical protein
VPPHASSFGIDRGFQNGTEAERAATYTHCLHRFTAHADAPAAPRLDEQLQQTGHTFEFDAGRERLALEFGRSLLIGGAALAAPLTLGDILAREAVEAAARRGPYVAALQTTAAAYGPKWHASVFNEKKAVQPSPPVLLAYFSICLATKPVDTVTDRTYAMIPTRAVAHGGAGVSSCLYTSFAEAGILDTVVKPAFAKAYVEMELIDAKRRLQACEARARGEGLGPGQLGAATRKAEVAELEALLSRGTPADIAAHAPVPLWGLMGDAGERTVSVAAERELAALRAAAVTAAQRGFFV